MGLLDNDKTCEVVENNQVQGYVFTERSTVPGVDQLQRWFLFSTYSPVHYGGPNATLRRAGASPWNGITTAAAFVTEVQRQFRTGDRYIKVNCSPAYTPASPGWAQIPVTMTYPPFPALPVVQAHEAPQSPLAIVAQALAGGSPGMTRVEIENARYQLPAGELEIGRLVFRPAYKSADDLNCMQIDPGTGKIWQASLTKGFTYTSLVSGTTNHPVQTYERFLFINGYAPVPGQTNTKEAILQGIADFGSGLAGWVGYMNANCWGATSGNTVVICSCSWGYTAQDVGVLERAASRARKKR